MIKNTIYFGVLLLITININKVKGQQDPKISQFMYNHTTINPGSAGNNDMICVNALTRQQWVGFDGAPEDVSISVNAPFSLLGADHGVGLSIYRDTWGNYSNIDLRLSYAYRIQVRDGKLGIGIGGGVFNSELETNNWLSTDELNNSGVGGEDMAIPRGDQNVFAFDMNAGLFYRSEYLYLGLSATNILESEIRYPNETSSGNNDTFEKKARHYYLTASYNVQLNNPSFEIIPSVLVQSDAKVTEFDLNAIVRYNKKFWGGVTYRPANAIVGMVGIEIFNGLKVGYAYDFATTKLTQYNQGSHEIVLNYCFRIGVEKSPKQYKSIRYL